ncbi:MAG: hypothetical protein WA869_11160, partial [Alloacidobacterium sp.]
GSAVGRGAADVDEFKICGGQLFGDGLSVEWRVHGVASHRVRGTEFEEFFGGETVADSSESDAGGSEAAELGEWVGRA